MTDPRTALVAVVRDESRRVLATLVRTTGSWELAEDAVQDAVVRALETWPRDGVPPEPRAWLTLTARRRALDVLRREAVRDRKQEEAWSMVVPVAPPPDSIVRDDLLRLFFTCCHPALSAETQVALALRTLGGLTTAETARALLVPEPVMAKRLTRAKQKIVRAGIPYRVPADSELPDRLRGVAATVYLLFNEGWAPSGGGNVLRPPLLDEAVRLARLLHALMPDEPTVLGLLALLLLHDARRAGRVGADGLPVLLADQDRNRWDRALVEEGVLLLGEGLRRTPDRPDPYVVQAALAACHLLAPDSASTDWAAICSWYDVLLEVQDTAAARLARAVALGERDGPQAGLDALDAVAGLEGTAALHAGRAELLRRLGRTADAVRSYDRALVLPLSTPQARHLDARRQALRAHARPVQRDPHSGPVPPAAWAADAAARARGRVAIFNAVRPDGLDGGWTMDERIWELMRTHVLESIDELADPDGTVALKAVVDLAQERYATHELFPKGRVRNYCTFTKVDLEARCEVERVPGRSPQRIRRWRPNADG